MSTKRATRHGSAPIERKVLRFVRSQDMLQEGSRLLIGVSGGPDSVCLLHLMTRLRDDLGLSLHAAHLDHGLRGEASDADCRYVLDLCHKLDVPVTAEKVDLAALRRRHSPMEETAREARYSFFCRVAREVQAGGVATGHTADDHLETILLHLVRGAGTRGLCGIEPVTQLRCTAGEVRLVRPLLEVRRDETAEYCRHFELSPRTDATNLSLDLLRNRIRLELLPLLRSYNPGFDAILARTARIARDEQQALERWSAKEWPSVAKRDAGVIRLESRRLLELPVGLRRILLRRAIKEARGDLRDVSAAHVESLMQALEMQAGKKVRLIGGLEAATGYGEVVVGAREAPQPLVGEYPLAVPGETCIPGWEVLATVTDREAAEEPCAEGGLAALLDYDAVGPDLVVRSRRDGDRFQPLGMPTDKKLQDFMVDARVPRGRRDEVPIVRSRRHIVWVVDWRIDHRARLTEATRRVLRLRFSPI